MGDQRKDENSNFSDASHESQEMTTQVEVGSVEMMGVAESKEGTIGSMLDGFDSANYLDAFLENIYWEWVGNF